LRVYQFRHQREGKAHPTRFQVPGAHP
jgi:hypothetical protein